jgi:hypothetical protein
MARANTDNSITSRRRFITVAAAASAVSATALAAAAMPVHPACTADPVLALIESHKKAMALINALGLPVQDDLLAAASSEEFDCFMALIEASPTTLAGITALLTHLDWVEKKDPWKFEDTNPTPLIAGLAKALSQIAA